MNGKLNRVQLTTKIEQSQIILTPDRLLNLTYNYSEQELPIIIDDYLSQLPGGEDWSNRRN